MTQTQMAVLVIAVIVAVAVLALLVLRRRSAKLRARFGSEYDRVVAEKGNRFKAEAQLESIEKRVKSYSLQTLDAADRDRFHPGMSTEFLARLAELIGDSLAGAGD